MKDEITDKLQVIGRWAYTCETLKQIKAVDDFLQNFRKQVEVDVDSAYAFGVVAGVVLSRKLELTEFIY